jgi:hypothetical protein
MPIKINNEKTRKSCIIKTKANLQKSGTNGLIGTTSAPLSDCFLGEYSWIILQKKSSKKYFSIYIFLNYTILLRFMLKFCQKYVIFKVFQVHLQVLL